MCRCVPTRTPAGMLFYFVGLLVVRPKKFSALSQPDWPVLDLPTYTPDRPNVDPGTVVVRRRRRR